MKIHIDVEGYFDYGNKTQRASLTIDRETGIATIRIKGRHDVVTTTAAALASLGYQKDMRQRAEESKTRRRRKVGRGLLTLGR